MFFFFNLSGCCSETEVSEQLYLTDTNIYFHYSDRQNHNAGVFVLAEFRGGARNSNTANKIFEFLRSKNLEGESRAGTGTAFAPAQGIEAEQKPAGFLLERIARFFAARRRREPQKMRPTCTQYAACSKPGTAYLFTDSKKVFE
ncbi:MAG: hypothetical protein LBH51_07665 [Treponema sp.]|jgi:hypothetical protein|nr:hypothetical protein [Treponema sp.]